MQQQEVKLKIFRAHGGKAGAKKPMWFSANNKTIIRIYNHILYAKNTNGKTLKPVLAENKILTEILPAHTNFFHCAGEVGTVRNVKKT